MSNGLYTTQMIDTTTYQSTYTGATSYKYTPATNNNVTKQHVATTHTCTAQMWQHITACDDVDVDVWMLMFGSQLHIITTPSIRIEIFADSLGATVYDISR